MAKRFTDTEKWEKDWFLNLRPLHKLFWQYLCDNCTPAGIWEVSWKLASARIGVRLKPEEMVSVFEKQYIPLDDGRRWFLVDFIPFQYGLLRENNPAHRNILLVLKKYGLLASDLSIAIPNKYLKGASKPLQSTFQGAKDMDKATDKVMDKVREGGHPMLFDSAVRVAWEAFVSDRKERRKPMTGRAQEMALSHLAELSGGDPVIAVKIINQSIRSGWQGLFPLKENSDGQRKNTVSNPGSQAARASFRHDDERQRKLAELKAGLDLRDRERGERSGPG